MPRRGSEKGIGTWKKIIIFGIIAALAASTFTLVYSSRLAEEQQAKQAKEAEKKQEELFRLSRCGDGVVRSTAFVREYMLPAECAMPVGITVDDRTGHVWVASSVTNSVFRLDPATGMFQEFKLPSEGRAGAGSIPLPMWALALDNHGRLWITDSEGNSIWMYDTAVGGSSGSNAEAFREFRLQKAEPFGTSMPVDMKINRDKLWFVGVYSKHIGMIDLNTLELVEIPVEVDLDALGTLDVDGDGNVWFTALTLGTKGVLYRLDPVSRDIKRYDLPIGSPVGISIDEARGRIWINDHGSNRFISFDPSSGKVIEYSTSLPARYTNVGLYEDCIKSSPRIECSGYPVSLPYWNAMDSRGRVWFNEHQGNAIAVFDPDDSTLIEYNIPSYNRAWGKCDGYESEPCGIANVLRFALQDDGDRVRVWFTEFTENKVGVLDPDARELPFTVRVESDTIHVRNGDTASIDLIVEAKEPLSLEMLASGIEASGRLKKLLAEYDKYEIVFDAPSSKRVTLTLKPNGLESGEYTLTVGARSNEITYSKIVRLVVE